MRRRKEAEQAHERDEGEPHVAKARRCLSCLKSFASNWVGERICMACRRSSTWRSGSSKAGAAEGA